MKKYAFICCVLLLIFGIATLGFAETSANSPATTPTAPTPQPTKESKPVQSTEVIKGTIVSMDAAGNKIVLKEFKTSIEKMIVVDPSVLSKLKVGEEVKVMLKAGGNVAESVKKIEKKQYTKKSGKK